MRGKIFAINKKKGFGFIMSEDIPFTRIFFHWTSLIGDSKFLDLRKNTVVDFELKQDAENGHSAIKIIPVENAITEARVESLTDNDDE